MSLYFVQCNNLRSTVRFVFITMGQTYEQACLMETLYLVNFWPCIVNNDLTFYLEECSTPGALMDEFRALSELDESAVTCSRCKNAFPRAYYSRNQARKREPKCRACVRTERSASDHAFPAETAMVTVTKESFHRFFRFVVATVLEHNIEVPPDPTLVRTVSDVLLDECNAVDEVIDFPTLPDRVRRVWASVVFVRREMTEARALADTVAGMVHELQNVIRLQRTLVARFAKIESTVHDLLNTSPKLCVVCMDAIVDIKFVPCGHQSTCRACYDRLVEKKCPVCRAPVDHVEFKV